MALRQAGWKPARDERHIEDNFVNSLGVSWLPVASAFVREYGGLNIAHTLWTWDKPVTEHALIDLGARVAAVAMSKVMAVASSNYMGDGCVIWIDEAGRFYAVDSEGMVFLGADEVTALDVLLAGTPPPEAPASLRQKLDDAYEWEKPIPSSSRSSSTPCITHR